MLSSREVGDEPLEMETKAISMVLNRQLPSDISSKPAKIKDSHVTFPPPGDLLSSEGMGMTHVDTQVWKDTRINRERDRKMDNQVERQTTSQKKQTGKYRDKKIEIDRQLEGSIQKQTDRQTDNTD